MRIVSSHTAITGIRYKLLRSSVCVSIIYAIISMFLLSSCYNSSNRTPDAWNLTEEQLDSISFSTTHHYSQNYNFVVKADTIRLVCQAPDELPFDSVTVVRGDRVVVADIMTMPADTIDSVWVKIARDQLTQVGSVRTSCCRR